MTPLAARTARGALHVVRETRAGFEPACFRRTLGRRTVAAVYTGHQRDVAWRHERVCADCDTLKRKGWRQLLRITGWR